MYAVGRYIQCSLNHRAFGCQYHDFLVHVPESRTYSPRVTDGKALSATCQSADNISTVPAGAGSTEHIGQVNPVLDGMSDVHALKAFRLAFLIQPLHLAVQTVSHLFQHDISIGILARMLSASRNVGKNLIDISQIEVTAQRQILGPPVVAAEKRMHIRDSALSRSGITEVSHIKLSGKRQALLGIFRIAQLCRCQFLEIGMYITENLSDGSRSQRALTEHIFFSRIRLQFDTSQTGSFLSAVMLFFHQQIQLIQAIHPGAILLLIIFQRFEQTNHCDTALMLQWFHNLQSFFKALPIYEKTPGLPKGNTGCLYI